MQCPHPTFPRPTVQHSGPRWSLSFTAIFPMVIGVGGSQQLGDGVTLVEDVHRAAITIGKRLGRAVGLREDRPGRRVTVDEPVCVSWSRWSD